MTCVPYVLIEEADLDILDEPNTIVLSKCRLPTMFTILPGWDMSSKFKMEEPPNIFRTESSLLLIAVLGVLNYTICLCASATGVKY